MVFTLSFDPDGPWSDVTWICLGQVASTSAVPILKNMAFFINCFLYKLVLAQNVTLLAQETIFTLSLTLFHQEPCPVEGGNIIFSISYWSCCLYHVTTSLGYF